MSTGEVRVRLAPGATSGFAALVAQYLEQVLEDGAAARRARRLRGRVAVTARDQAASVTLDLQGDEIVVCDGVAEQVDAAITAPALDLLALLRGEGHPLRDHLRGRLRIRVTLRRLLLPLRVYGLMRLRPQRA